VPSKRTSGQWVGQRRLRGGYMAGMETKNPKPQTIGAASTVETSVELHLVSVEGPSGRPAILIVISHPV
jgi:hypothetical protein